MVTSSLSPCGLPLLLNQYSNSRAYWEKRTLCYAKIAQPQNCFDLLSHHVDIVNMIWYPPSQVPNIWIWWLCWMSKCVFGKFLLCTAKRSWKNIVNAVDFRSSTALWTKFQTLFPKYWIFLCKSSPINLGVEYFKLIILYFSMVRAGTNHQQSIVQFYKLKPIFSMDKLRLRHFETVIWPGFRG